MTSARSADALRMAVLGCADIAWRRMLPAMVADPGVRVAAIASRRLSRASEFTDRFGGAPVEGYGALLDRDDVDAVYIPLPARMHAEWIERALLAGKHVLAEKPMTDNPADTGRLQALAATLWIAYGLVIKAPPVVAANVVVAALALYSSMKN